MGRHWEMALKMNNNEGNTMSEQLVELRASINDLKEQVAKLWTSFRELATVFWGDDKTRDNGIRSNVRDLEINCKKAGEDFIELQSKLQRYLDKERAETCHGLKALEEHAQEGEQDINEEADVKVAEIQANAMKEAAKAQSMTSIIVQCIVAIGVILALILK